MEEVSLTEPGVGGNNEHEVEVNDLSIGQVVDGVKFESAAPVSTSAAVERQTSHSDSHDVFMQKLSALDAVVDTLTTPDLLHVDQKK